MLRNFVKSRISDVWRISGDVADRAVGLASGPLRSVVGVAPTGVQQALSVIGSGAVGAMKTSMRIGEDLQRRTVDLAFDAAELQPVTGALAEAGSPVYAPRSKWSQHQAQLDYLKAVNDVGPTDTSLNTILLAVAYSSVMRSQEGVETFEGYLVKFKDQATPKQRAIYLSCLALLRASEAQSAPAWELLTTISSIEKLKAELAEAVELTAGEPDYAPGHFKILPRWVSGLLLANLPWPFGDKEAAMEKLLWCESAITASVTAYVGSCPFMVETYYNLAKLNRDAGKTSLAEAYLAKSGLSWDRPPIQFVTPFSVSSEGLRDTPEYIQELVEGKVFSALGFDISSMHYVVSEDGSELIAVDAASRIDCCASAYKAFIAYYRSRYPDKSVPIIKNVLMTHFHWDHAGGLDFYRTLNSDVKVTVYASANFVYEAQHTTRQPPPYEWFLGARFNVATLAHYDPDEKVESETSITLGGTEVRLMPLPGGGGETPDGMFVYFPGHGVMFVGDIMVPWVGSPYVQEGSPEALLQTLDFSATISPAPSTLIHGHTAMSLFYPTVDTLVRMRRLLGWLFDETRSRIYAGQNRSQILADPLVAPALLDSTYADLYFPFLIMREPFVSRVYVTTVGYWGARLENVDNLSDEQIGPVVALHMDLSEDDFAACIQRMEAAGDIDVAGRVVVWGLARYPDSKRLKDAETRVFQLLMQKYQMLNPFKLTMYANHIGTPAPQLAPASSI